MSEPQPDVVILGGGLAGQNLARHLLLDTDKRILMLEKRDEIHSFHQKVGESSVQLAGHYFGKVLGLESYLLHEHFMKYNLRFYFRSGARKNDNFEDYGHISIRPFSNVPSYQLNRNTLEAEIFRRNQEEKDRFTVEIGATDLDVEIVPDGLHRIQYRMGTETRQAEATWVLDASGRNRFLARKLGLRKPMAIHNNTFFWWVEGTVDIEKLTSRSRQEIRLKRERGTLGHLPVFLATNHFCVEGLWFWVIPLQGKTSLGLVYDSKVLRHGDINSVEKATAWVLEHVTLRPGFRELARRHRPAIVSSGFHELIEPVLRREQIMLEVLANSIDPTPGGWIVKWRDETVCDTCGEACKRGVLAGEPYVYAGDGYSDRCAALAAERVFARDGLALWLDAEGVAFEPFDDFHDILAALG